MGTSVTTTGPLTTTRPVSRHAIVAVLAGLLGLLPVGATGSATARSAPSRSAPSRPAFSRSAPAVQVAQFNREDYHHSSSRESLATEARHNQVVVLNWWDGPLVPELHRLNPRVKVLIYVFAGWTDTGDAVGRGVCATVARARAGNYFLRGANGAPLNNPSVPGSLGVDPGNPVFQRDCGEHAAALAHRFGFDGVYFDGLDAVPSYHFPSVRSISGYSPAGYRDAVYRLIRCLHTILHHHHLLLVGNVGLDNTPGLWERWAAVLDGTEEESWTDGGLGLRQQIPFFDRKLHNVAWSQAHHRMTLLHTYGTSEAADTYALAAMLLVAGGDVSLSTSADYTRGFTQWWPEYTAAERLGAPLGPYTRRRDGVYLRRFQHGLVVVNASGSAKGPVGLGGLYSGSGIAHTTAAALAPTSGLVLLAG